ncbi:testis-expressed protein 45 [Phaeobacter sp. BS23]
MRRDNGIAQSAALTLDRFDKAQFSRADHCVNLDQSGHALDHHRPTGFLFDPIGAGALNGVAALGDFDRAGAIPRHAIVLSREVAAM